MAEGDQNGPVASGDVRDGSMVAMRDIRKFAEAIAREFKLQRILLFGSYAYGKPTEDSDVDLMVVMPYDGSSTGMAVKIRLRMNASFPLDLLVRSPKEIQERYRLEDWFIREVIDKGRVLYETPHHRVDREGRG